MSNEQDLPGLPKVDTESPQQPKISRIKFLRRITSNLPLQYEAVLGAYARAPQMPGEQLISKETTKYTGDTGKTLEVDLPVPGWWTNIKEPIKKDNELLLPRLEQQEIIYVSPESESPPSIILEKFSKPQISSQSNPIKPPYPPKWQVIEGKEVPITQSSNEMSELDAARAESPFLNKRAA